MSTTIGADGWFVEPNDPNAKTVYASPNGSDTAGDGTLAKPFRTIARSQKDLRQGYPDRLKLQAGGTFDQLNSWLKSGPADPNAPPMSMGVYNGTDRARLATDELNKSICRLTRINNVLLRDFELFLTKPFHAVVVVDGADLWFENVRMVGGEMGFDLGWQDNPATPAINEGAERVWINRCQVLNMWSQVGGRSQGLYSTGTDGLTITNSVFDHNGWNESLPLFLDPEVDECHNVYLSEHNWNVVGIGNFLGRACSHGWQLRCGGFLARNYFWLNPIHAFGQGDFAAFCGNVLAGSGILGQLVPPPTHPSYAKIMEQQQRGWVYDAEAAINVVTGNVAWGNTQPAGKGYSLNSKVRTVLPLDYNVFASNILGPWTTKYPFRNSANRMLLDLYNTWDYAVEPTGMSPFEVETLRNQQRAGWKDPTEFVDHVIGQIPRNNGGSMAAEQQAFYENKIKGLDDQVKNQRDLIAQANATLGENTRRLNLLAATMKTIASQVELVKGEIT